MVFGISLVTSVIEVENQDAVKHQETLQNGTKQNFSSWKVGKDVFRLVNVSSSTFNNRVFKNVWVLEDIEDNFIITAVTTTEAMDNDVVTLDLHYLVEVGTDLEVWVSKHVRIIKEISDPVQIIESDRTVKAIIMEQAKKVMVKKVT